MGEMSNPIALLNYFLSSGDLGTFSEEEKLLARRVFTVASHEVNAKGCYDTDSDSDDEDKNAAFEEKIEATKKNFKEIIRLFREAEKAKQKYMSRCPKWRLQRLENIAQLRELAEKINTDRRNCNISKITSTCVSILGGAAIGASFAFPPLALILAPVGLATSTLGGLTVFGTSVTEIQLLKKHMSKAQEVRVKDEKDFKLIGLWFKHSQALIDSFEKIMGFSVATEMSKDLKSFKEDLGEVSKLWKGKMPSGLVNIIKNTVVKMMGVEAGIGGAAALIPVVLAFFIVIVLLRKHNCLIFDSVVLCHRIVFGMIRLFDLGGDLGLLISAAVMKAGGAAAADITANTARVVFHGVFAGIGVALDLTNLAFASIDIHRGSISPYAVQLQTAADQLQKEHDLLLKIYSELAFSLPT